MKWLVLSQIQRERERSSTRPAVEADELSHVPALEIRLFVEDAGGVLERFGPALRRSDGRAAQRFSRGFGDAFVMHQ
jgi:hypothetical protein